MEREQLMKLQDIERRMKLNPKDYKVYVELGDYYSNSNISKMYLCYEHSLLYCDDEADKKIITKKIEELQDRDECIVKPASIVILSYKSRKLLEDCINSIRRTCYPTEYEMVIVDNGSDEETIKYLEIQEDIVLRVNKENAGFPAGCNQGIALAKADNDIMLLNNDTIMCVNSLFWLRMALYDDAKVGACGSVTNYAINEQIVYIPREDEEEYNRLIEVNNSNIVNVYEPKMWLVGFAVLIRRNALNDVGLLDEIFTPGNLEDVDLGVRLSKAGYRQYLCHNSYIIHIGSQSFGKDTDKYKDIIDKNTKKFIDKWGQSPKDIFDGMEVRLFDKVLSETDRKNLRRCIGEKRDADFWKHWVGKRIEEDMMYYNELVCKGDKDSISKIFDRIKEPGYVMKYRRSTALTALIVYLSIYEQEIAKGIEHHIFSKGYNLEELEEIFNELKFALWRVEFIGDIKSQEDILKLIQKCNVSDEYIMVLIKTSAINQAEANYLLGYLLRSIGREMTSIKLYHNALEIMPDDEYILCELADIFWKYGKVDIAMNYMKRITHPTTCTEKYLSKWEGKNE